MRIGIFGGTFNPVHTGHLIAAEEIREAFHLSKVLFVPSGRPPHKPSPELADAGHRLEMCRLAVSGNPAFEVSAVELEGESPSYTVETLETLGRSLGSGVSLFFLAGVDAFSEIDTWHDPERLLHLCHFIVLSRPGFSLDLTGPILSRNFGVAAPAGERHIPLPGGHTLYLAEVTPVAISSSTIRERIRRGLSVKYHLPESVESYILAHHLYGHEA